jgi:hypothetical protein
MSFFDSASLTRLLFLARVPFIRVPKHAKTLQIQDMVM